MSTRIEELESAMKEMAEKRQALIAETNTLTQEMLRVDGALLELKRAEGENEESKGNEETGK